MKQTKNLWHSMYALYSWYSEKYFLAALLHKETLHIVHIHVVLCGSFFVIQWLQCLKVNPHVWSNWISLGVFSLCLRCLSIKGLTFSPFNSICIIPISAHLEFVIYSFPWSHVIKCTASSSIEDQNLLYIVWFVYFLNIYFNIWYMTKETLQLYFLSEFTRMPWNAYQPKNPILVALHVTQTASGQYRWPPYFYYF